MQPSTLLAATEKMAFQPPRPFEYSCKWVNWQRFLIIAIIIINMELEQSRRGQVDQTGVLMSRSWWGEGAELALRLRFPPAARPAAPADV